MKEISEGGSSIKGTTFPQETLQYFQVISYFCAKKLLIIATRGLMEVQSAYLLCMSGKHVYMKADLVLKSYPEKPESKPKVLGKLESKWHFVFF